MMSIENRLAALEKSNRRLRLSLVFAVLAGGGAIALGLTRPAPIPDLIQARKFEVLNDKGAPVVWLEANARGGAIHTNNNEGKRLFNVTSGEDGSGRIATLDGNGHDTAVLHASGGGGMLMTFDSKGTKMLSVGVAPNGDPAITAYGHVGEVRSSWPK